MVSNLSYCRIVIKEEMKEKKISLGCLSKKSNISFIKLLYLLYIPFSTLKLSHGLSISKSLGISLSKLF